MIEEIWKPIKDYEGLYEVSNLGRVKGLKRNKILTPHLSSWGYPQIGLCKNGIEKTFRIHKIVARAFIPNVNNCRDVDHIDGDRTNNNVSNLRWCSHTENMNNPHYLELRRKCIVQANLNGTIIAHWKGAREIERQTGYNNSNILQCCKGKRKSAHGFKWFYN